MKAIVKPELLKWAIDNSGFSIEEIARKLSKKPQSIILWLEGRDRPTINQLNDLANICKRPLEIFYLDYAPLADKPLKDFRRLPGQTSRAYSSKYKLELRKARYRRQVAINLLNDLNEDSNLFDLKCSILDDPEEVGTKTRNYLGVSLKIQLTWDKYDANKNYTRWRNLIEEKGVLVFQSSGVSERELLGFSESERPLPFLVVNNKCSPNKKIFTLFHELTHIMLGISGECDIEFAEELPPEESKIEVFCNHVAGAILVPKDALLDDDIVKNRKTNFSDDNIKSLASKFGVSQEVILRRLLITSQINKTFYANKQQQYVDQYLEKQAKKNLKKELKIPTEKKVLSSTGLKYANIIFESLDRELITFSDITEYLDIKNINNINKIQNELLANNIRHGVL